jgi:hypothetical protein
MRYSRLAVVCAGLALLLSGCIFSPTKGPGGGGIEPPKYQVPQNPNAVMYNLKTAYTAKDSAGYKACFDPRYIGTTQDAVLQTPVDTLYFTDEAKHIAALARSAANVDLELKPTVVRSSDAGDPPGWALIQDPIHSLAIYDGANIITITPTNENIEFRFIPKTPDSSSPTDTTWKIIKWTEVLFATSNP